MTTVTLILLCLAIAGRELYLAFDRKRPAPDPAAAAEIVQNGAAMLPLPPGAHCLLLTYSSLAAASVTGAGAATAAGCACVLPSPASRFGILAPAVPATDATTATDAEIVMAMRVLVLPMTGSFP